MQKAIGYLSIILAVLSFSSHNAYSQTPTCGLHVDNVMAKAGETFLLSVPLNDAPNKVEAFGFDLSFDQSVLQYTGTFTRGALVAQWSFFDVSAPEPGTIRVGGFTVPGPIEAGQSGTVVELEFRVVCSDCAAGDTAELTLSNLVDDIAAWRVCPGAFHFIHCVQGQGLQVGNYSGSPDTNIVIPVTIAESQGALNRIETLGFNLVYEPHVLRYTGSYTKGSLVANWPFFGVSILEPGMLRVGGLTVSDAIPTGQNGTVVHLEFEVICSDCLQGDSTPVLLETLVDDIEGWPACMGTYAFGCSHGGDVDESGEVTPQDALLTLEHFLHLTTLEGCQQVQADVDGDGQVTPADALEILAEFIGI